MSQPEQIIRKALGPEYDHSGKPHVYFFDHAMPIDSPDRPRFKNAVYISKTSKTSLDTQKFNAKASEQDKQEYPREWEHYLKVKETLSKPRVAMLPGIDVATLAEMKAIEIVTLEQLLAQDLFEDWQPLARRILHAINQNGTEERQILSSDQTGQPERILAGNTGTSSPGQTGINGTGQKEKGKEKGYQESSPQEITFDFGMTL